MAAGPSKISDRWIKRKDKLKLATLLRYQSNLDLNYGSSGSPVLDRRCNLVGVLSNFASGSANLSYEFKALNSRCMFISTPAIVEVLKNVYDARNLVQEFASEQ